MLDRMPFFRDSESCKRNAILYHDRLKTLSLKELEKFSLELATASLQLSTSQIVLKIEKFMNCQLPFDHKILEGQLAMHPGKHHVMVHLAMCPLLAVAGKQETGTEVGVDCSLFGRFHNRLEGHLFSGMFPLQYY